jgi:hypothetical protein
MVRVIGNMRKCICSKCPSFPGRLMEIIQLTMPGLYCATGRSRSNIEKRGCMCGNCRVQKESGLRGAYYCIEGVSREVEIVAEKSHQHIAMDFHSSAERR